MNRLLLCWLLFLAFFNEGFCSSILDLQRPFGFCTCSSRTASVPFAVTGGGCYAYPVEGVSEADVITLTSTGHDMREALAAAIRSHRVVVLDGSQGDFLVSATIALEGLSGRTVLGIRGARLCTQWQVSPEIAMPLSSGGFDSMSTSSGTGGILTNGRKVAEQAEYCTRQTIIDLTGDVEEHYRHSGIFLFRQCENIILRNLIFVGPGAIDVGGDDLLSFWRTRNSWVDHCEFTDGMDGNFDITQQSDFITVSWCIFAYTARSLSHRLSNLIGGSDREVPGCLNTTFAFNHWGQGCQARMPMARAGIIHLLNNRYTCAGSQLCINARANSELLAEGNFFAEGVGRCFGQAGAKAVSWSESNVITELPKVLSPSFGPPVAVPYPYKVTAAAFAASEVEAHSGATLFPEPIYK